MVVYMDQMMAISRYSRVAMLFHWLTAAAVVSMIPMGWWMTSAVHDPQQQQTAYRLFQLHKSIGFAILALTTARLVWRLLHKAPPMPAGMKPWERFAAEAVHAGFYFLLFALPLTGWAYVSTGWSASGDQPLAVATSFFGLFPVPHLPGLADASAALRREIAFQSLGAHSLMAWGAVLLFILHAGAALHHQFIHRDDVLAHMLPMLKLRQPTPANEARNGNLKGAFPYIAGAVCMALVGIAGWISARPAPAVLTEASAPSSAATPAVATADIEVTPGSATQWAINRDSSSIGFTGTHAGATFEGRFDDWKGHVWFDPADLAGSRAVILVKTASARTGDATQEGSLREKEWLDPAGFSIARFEADEFRALGGNRFEAKGALTIKDRTVPVLLPFTFNREGTTARVEGAVELDRIALGLGLASDANASWVSRAITVRIAVTANTK